jgi:D-serine ammonia-lyase
LSHETTILLILDNEAQLAALEEMRLKQQGLQPWGIFIKVDVGYHRAGLPPDSPRLQTLLQRVLHSSAVKLCGFYGHAGHSYDSTSLADARDTLDKEVSQVVAAAKLVSNQQSPIILSFGSTPTAHVVDSIRKIAPPRMKFELHTGKTTFWQFAALLLCAKIDRELHCQ